MKKVIAALLILACIALSGCKSRQRDIPRRSFAEGGMEANAPTTIAIAPVRNLTQSALNLPRDSDFLDAAETDFSRPQVTYLLREISALQLVAKNYRIISNTRFDNLMEQAEQTSKVNEQVMCNISEADAVLQITIKYWNIAEIHKKKVITLDGVFTLLRKPDAKVIWQHVSFRKTITLDDPLKSQRYEFYIEKFLSELYEDLPDARR